MENESTNSKNRIIKSIYFYLVSFVALMMIVFSTANMIDVALKTWVFTSADGDIYYGMSCIQPTMESDSSPKFSVEDCERQKEESRIQQEKAKVAQRQRDIVRDISMIAVGVPLFLVHWKIVRRKDENL
ncbi:MAG: hypothetical protein ABH919_03955 [bacterium]